VFARGIFDLAMMYPTNSQPLDVLVVEDDPDQGGILVQALVASGFAAALVRNGDAALDRLTASPTLPGALVLDLQMPGLNGWDLISVVRSYPKLSALPIIVVSGHEAGEARDYPRVTFMHKPLDLQHFLGTNKRLVPRTPPQRKAG
jgi:DNA-binding response OmpR family regulator